MTAEAALDFPPLRVVVDAARAAQFAREIGAEGAPDAAPLAYPALWLATPAIHEAIARICAEADSVPVHESQRFFYEAPLRPGAQYDLYVVMRREATPPRLSIEARVETPSGAPVARIETLLRLVSRTQLFKDLGA